MFEHFSHFSKISSLWVCLFLADWFLLMDEHLFSFCTLKKARFTFSLEKTSTSKNLNLKKIWTERLLALIAFFLCWKISLLLYYAAREIGTFVTLEKKVLEKCWYQQSFERIKWKCYFTSSKLKITSFNIKRHIMLNTC